MKILHELIDAIKELAVVNAMNVGAAAFGLRPTSDVEAGKQKLMSLVSHEILDDGTVILKLDMNASISVGPLYAVFGGAWTQAAVCDRTLRFLRNAPVLKEVSDKVKLRMI